MTRDWADAPFVRIYSSVFTDEKFAPIFALPRGFEWYARLLIGAKQHYPTPAPIPRSLPQKVLATLVAVGVVVVVGDDYSMSGLAKEMADVSEVGRAGGLVRAATAARDESGRFGSSETPLPANTDEGRADIEAFLQVRHRLPTPPQRRVLDDILSRHDVTGPQWAADIILRNPADAIGAVIRADKEWREGRKASAIVEESERKRRPQGFKDPVLREIAAAMKERYPEEVPV